MGLGCGKSRTDWFWLQAAPGHAGLAKDVVVVVSWTFEDPADPCLLVPTKFVGSLYA